MPSPKELEILGALRAAPQVEPTEPTVTMVKGGETIQVPESQHIDYLGQGYDDSRFVEGGQYNPTLSGTVENVLARGEALDRGATGGLGGLVGSLGSAAVDQFMPAGGDIGQAAGAGLNAPQLETAFGDSFHAAEQERRQRAEALGGEGYAWEMAGGLATLGAGTLAKGGAMAALASPLNPGALAERLGTKAASKILGEQAAAGILKTAGARAVGGLTEGALMGLEQGLVENVDLTLEDPAQAAQNVAMSTLVGGGGGAVLGGGFGIVEGTARAIGKYAPEIMRAGDPKPVVPQPQPVTVDQALQANVDRALVSSQLPEPQRGWLQRMGDEHDALINGERKVVDEGARSVTHVLDNVEKMELEMRTEAGIAQKQLVNEIALKDGFAGDIVERFDPDDVRMLDDVRRNADMSAQSRTAVEAELNDVAAKHQAALANEASARKALDDASAPVAVADGKAKRPTALELRPLRDALKAAERDAKALTKQLDSTRTRFGALDADHVSAQGALSAAPQPRRMTRLESESRDMFQGLKDGIDAEIKKVGEGTGPDYQNLMTMRNRVLAHEAATVQAFRDGDFGAAHNLMDQGLKDSIDDTFKRAQSGEIQAFASNIYNVPRSFLENPQAWGPDIAGRNAKANPTWHRNMVASRDSGYQGLLTQVGEVGFQGRGNRRGANSAAVSGLMKQLGTQSSETAETGVRRALRAKVEDFSNRANAWGTDRAKEIADQMAKAQTHIEDTFDTAALTLRDAAQAQQRKSAMELLGPVGSVANATIALPVMAKKFLVDTVGQYRNGIANMVAQGASKMVTGVRVAGQQAVQANSRRMGAQQRQTALQEGGTSREKAISDAQARLDIGSPQLRELVTEGLRTDAISPGLGSALVEQRLKTDAYIVAHMPQKPSQAIFSPPARSTDAAATTLDRILVAANSPGKAFARVVDGAATPEDLDFLRTIYPGPYQALVDNVMAEIQRNPRRVKSNSVKMYLSRVVGQPLLPSLMNIAKAQERAKAATQQAEDAGKPMDGGDGVTARAPITLSTDPENVYASRADAVMAR